jgi:ABC-type antimicrobial peptide transport system permease subunit
MTEHLSGVLKPQRLGLMLFSLFGGLAVVLTAFGLYALVAYAVAHRTKEIGIRVALGADARRVVALVIRQGLLPIAVGLVLGVVAFQLSGWAIAKFLFAIPLMAGAPLAIMTGAIAVIAGLAMLAPARRALAVDPVAALRND